MKKTIDRTKNNKVNKMQDWVP